MEGFYRRITSLLIDFYAQVALKMYSFEKLKFQVIIALVSAVFLN